MPDLSTDLRDYFDAVVGDLDAVEPQTYRSEPPRPTWRRRMPAGIALIATGVAAAVIAAQLVDKGDREHLNVGVTTTVPPDSAPSTVATATRDGRQVTLRLVSPQGRSGSEFAVEVTIANVGGEPFPIGGSLEPDACRGFPVGVEAVRVAWEPGGQPWPGADHYLGMAVSGPGWSNIESRGSEFTDPLTERARQDVLDRTGTIVCNAAGVSTSFPPGATATRQFNWTPPDGWPGGDHQIVASVVLSSRLVGTQVEYERLTASIPVEVEAAAADGIGPAQALRALAADPAFQQQVDTRGGLLAITTQWKADGWYFTVQYGDGESGRWITSQSGQVRQE